jgi:hypothetical protein
MSAVVELTWDQIEAEEPQNYEVYGDGTFIFELKDGRRAKLTCKCGNTIWDIRYLKENKGIHFLVYCHACGKGTRLISIESPKK